MAEGDRVAGVPRSPGEPAKRLLTELTPPNGTDPVSSPPRILFLNQSYWPDGQATGRLLTQLCEDLAARDPRTDDPLEIRVVAGPPKVLEDGAKPPAKRETTRNGVRIDYVGRRRPARQGEPGKESKPSTLSRVLGMVYFTVATVWRTLTLPRPDVVVTETDPFFLPLVGWMLKRRHGCRFVAYLQDLYPDVAVAVDKVREGFVTRLIRRMLWAAYRRADRIVVLSDDMLERCVANGADRERCVVIPNWTDTESIVPETMPTELAAARGWEGKFVVMYSGNHGMAHEFGPIVEAADRLRDRPEIVFAMVGGGVRRRAIFAEAEARGLENIVALPHQPGDRLSDSLGTGHVHLLSVRPDAIDCVAPSKLYGIMAAARPTLALLRPSSSCAELIRSEALGVVCDVTQPEVCAEQLVDAILMLQSDPDLRGRMGDRARRLAVDEFSRSRLTATFGELLDHLALEGRPMPAARIADRIRETDRTREPVAAGDAIVDSDPELVANAYASGPIPRKPAAAAASARTSRRSAT